MKMWEMKMISSCLPMIQERRKEIRGPAARTARPRPQLMLCLVCMTIFVFIIAFMAESLSSLCDFPSVKSLSCDGVPHEPSNAL